MIMITFGRLSDIAILPQKTISPPSPTVIPAKAGSQRGGVSAARAELAANWHECLPDQPANAQVTERSVLIDTVMYRNAQYQKNKI